MSIKRITMAEIEYVAHRLAKETMNWSEPIPDFSTRFTNALERCIDQPFQSFGGKNFYPSLIKKAAILFYFLHINKKWISVDNQELYNFAKWVAESNPKLKASTIDAIEKFIKVYMLDLK